MKNIFEAEEAGRKVFSDERALSPEFVPDSLPGREKELEELAKLIKPIAYSKRITPLLIHGPPGTGKTTCVKYVMEQLKEYSDSVYCVYVNCWSHSSKLAVLSVIAEKLQLILPRRGLASDEVFARIQQCMKHDGKQVMLVLDEVDRLFHRREEKILYDVARSEGFGIACISNNEQAFSSLDERIKSSLQVRKLGFKRYTPLQLKEILGLRAKKAFIPGKCEEEAIALCAAHAAKLGGDARIAIETLWKAGLLAEERNAVSVSGEDARKAMLEVDEANNSKMRLKLDSLNNSEKLVLELLKKNGGSMNSGRLYEEYSGTSKETDRSVRNHVEELEKKGFVSVEESMLGIGRTRVVRLLFPTELLDKMT